MRATRSLPPAVKTFFWIALLLNSLAVTIEVGETCLAHRGWPYNSPLLDEPPAPDLTNYIAAFQHLHTAQFFDLSQPTPYMYPAPVAPLYGLFLSVPRHRVAVFLGTLSLITLGVVLLFAWRLARRGITILAALAVAMSALFLSYPLAFELKQGNMELFVFIIVGAGVWCFARERWPEAAILFGIAGAMKIFPFIYLGLFLAKKQYRPLVTAAIAAGSVTIVSLLYLDSSLSTSWHGVQQGLALYTTVVALHIWPQTGYDHSLLSVVKCGFSLHHPITPENFAVSMRAYLALVAVSGVAIFFIRIRKLPFINQVLALCISSIWLSPVSFDYTLLHLYIPWALLVLLAFDREKENPAGLLPALVCLAFLTSIQSEFILHGRSFGGQLKSVVLGLLFYVSLRYPFRSEAASEQAERELSTV